MNQVRALQKLNIKSLRDLEHRLLTDRETLRRLASRADELYQPFAKERARRPFQRPSNKPAKIRTIDNPATELKAVQTKILRRILDPLEPPAFIFGAVKERTIMQHAAAHMGASIVVKMDIQGFFPAVSSQHVFRIWRDVLGCSPKIAHLLTILTNSKAIFHKALRPVQPWPIYTSDTFTRR
jgi:hypothetical protein